jgi:hypothetical protein
MGEEGAPSHRDPIGKEGRSYGEKQIWIHPLLFFLWRKEGVF